MAGLCKANFSNMDHWNLSQLASRHPSADIGGGGDTTPRTGGLTPFYN